MSDRGSYRSIYSVLLDSPEFRSLSRDAKDALKTILLTRFNNMAHIFLCDEGGLVTIAAQMGVDIDVLQKALQELRETEWIYFQDNIIWIRNGLRYNPGINLTGQKHRQGVINILKSLPKSDIIIKYCEYYELDCPIDTPKKGYRKGIGGATEGLRSKEPIPDPDKEPDLRLTSSDEEVGGKPPINNQDQNGQESTSTPPPGYSPEELDRRANATELVDVLGGLTLFKEWPKKVKYTIAGKLLRDHRSDWLFVKYLIHSEQEYLNGRIRTQGDIYANLAEIISNSKQEGNWYKIENAAYAWDLELKTNSGNNSAKITNGEFQSAGDVIAELQLPNMPNGP